METTLTNAVAAYGAYAIFLLMAIDATLPLGSELIMLYAGVLTAGVVSGAHVDVLGASLAFGVPTYLALVAAGTLGSVAGGLLGYGIGAAGGSAIGRGRWSTARDAAGVERARAWLERRGAAAVFVGRVTPVVRSVISYPAGGLRLPLGPYLVATLLGGLLWCLVFAGAGWALGGAWETLLRDFQYANYATVAAILAVLALVVVRRVRGAGEAR
jgi:membrane protein DedA with SNARE-associated domain